MKGEVMDKKNCAVPAAATAKNGEGQVFLEGFDSIPQKYPTTTAHKSQFLIENFLLRGQDNALSVSTLERITGRSARRIGAAVQDARRRGVPVISMPSGGFFIASSEEERSRCLRSLKHRRSETDWTIFALERARIEDDYEQTEGR